MRAYETIQKKKRGEELSRDEIFSFFNSYGRGELPDYQVSALLMAICLRGMSHAETAALAEAIYLSGEALDLSYLGNCSADKHSTGGVGDKTTLILVPIAAAAGCKIAKMSGRGLGHTGGTIDKLESIPGFRTELTPDEFRAQVEKVGIAVVGQTKNLAPLDKKLYALRDVTATVDSVPLIASSVMGKKLASGAKNIVLDVKCGSGAFMKTKEQAESLAEAMVTIGSFYGRRVSALITDMNTPLGYAVGNALEVIEAAETLCGRGDVRLRELCLSLAAELVSAVKGITCAEGLKICREVLDSGKAYAKLGEWLRAQGAEERYAENPAELPLAKYSKEVLAPADGYIWAMDAEKIGMVSLSLGAGRPTKDAKIDLGAGIVLKKKTADPVKAGEPIAVLYSEKPSVLNACADSYLAAITISDEQPKRTPVILSRVG